MWITDGARGQPLDYLLHEGAVYAVASQPAAAEVVASACHDGAVRLFDGRVVAHDAVVEMTTRAGAFHDVTFQPGDGRVLATAHSAAGCQVTEFFWFFFITEFCSKLDSSGTGFFSGWL